MIVLPDLFTISIFILIILLLTMIAYILPKVLGSIVEIITSIAILIYLFVVFPFSEAMFLMSISAATYASFGMLLNRDNRKARQQLMEKLREKSHQNIDQKRDLRRFWLDVLLTLFVSAGAIIFLIFAPETYGLLKLFIIFALISISEQTIERIDHFFSTSLYWLPEEERLIVISLFQSRDYPLGDLKDVTRESAPDLLRLHPLFTFLSENRDYTQSFQAVLRLSFPGENVYFSPVDIDVWEKTFKVFIVESEEVVTDVLPIWHPKVLKRLFWKGYFAITVKGISAYTSLILLLVWLNVPSYVMVGFVVLWLSFNLYVSDRVLIAGTDAVEMEDGEVFNRARQIFKKAGIPRTKLYMIDSPTYNGLATGMNISKGTVMLTKATMGLPIDAVEAILAHEAVHIKNRDMLMNQIARILFIGSVVGAVYLFYDQLVVLAERPLILIPLFYVLMMSFPIYLSFVSQWMEMHADHLGSKLIFGGNKQMENGIRLLGNAQDQSLDKTFEYRMSEGKPLKNIASIERDKWFFRMIEFQFQAHPPLYFRIKCLSNHLSWKEMRNTWFMNRIKESLPDFLRKNKGE